MKADRDRTFTVVSVFDEDRRFVRERIIEHWGTDKIVVHGQIFEPHLCQGFLAQSGEKRLGLLTYRTDGSDCEILTLNNWSDRHGVGTSLLNTAIDSAKSAGCRRIWLVTTNDNLRALGFYQKRGFSIAAVHRGAVNRARELKPQIPRIGQNGIPLQDEIELEMVL